MAERQRHAEDEAGDSQGGRLNLMGSKVRGTIVKAGKTGVKVQTAGPEVVEASPAQSSSGQLPTSAGLAEVTTQASSVSRTRVGRNSRKPFYIQERKKHSVYFNLTVVT